MSPPRQADELEPVAKRAKPTGTSRPELVTTRAKPAGTNRKEHNVTYELFQEFNPPHMDSDIDDIREVEVIELEDNDEGNEGAGSADEEEFDQGNNKLTDEQKLGQLWIFLQIRLPYTYKCW